MSWLSFRCSSHDRTILFVDKRGCATPRQPQIPADEWGPWSCLEWHLDALLVLRVGFKVLGRSLHKSIAATAQETTFRVSFSVCWKALACLEPQPAAWAVTAQPWAKPSASLVFPPAVQGCEAVPSSFHSLPGGVATYSFRSSVDSWQKLFTLTA